MAKKKKKLEELEVVSFARVEQAWDEDSEAYSEMFDMFESIGHDDIPFSLDWDDETEWPHFKEYLVERYGKVVMEHTEFMLICY